MITLTALFFLLSTAFAATTLKINCGGPALSGYIADQPSYRTTTAYVGSFFNNGGGGPVTIYSSHSWSVNSVPLTYSLNVMTGTTYTVTVRFAENWSGAASPGFRILNLNINSVPVATNLDVYALSGNKLWVPYDVVETGVSPVGGKIVISIIPQNNNAMVSAIDIVPDAETTPTPLPSLTSSPSPSSPAATISASPSASNTPAASISASPSTTSSPPATVTASPSVSSTPAATVTASPSVTATVSASASLSSTPAATVTASPTVSSTSAATISASPSVTATVSASASLSSTPAATVTASPSVTSTPAATVTASPSQSSSPSASIPPNTPSASPSLTSSPSPSPSTSPPTSFSGTTLKVNCGGAALSDYVADQASFTSSTTSSVGQFFNNGGGGPVSVYSSHSYVGKGQPLVYSFDVIEGVTYSATLKFAENWSGAASIGFRILNIDINSARIATNLDVYQEAGSMLWTPHNIVETGVSPVGGKIVITITPVKQNAYISGIQIVPDGPTTPDVTPTPSVSTTPGVTTTPSVTKTPSVSITPGTTPTPSPSSVSPAAIPQVSFTRVFNDYPKRVFEAHGSILGGTHLVVMGGFFGFPGVTKDVYRRPVTTSNAPWEKMASMPEPVTHMAQVAFDNTLCGAGGFFGSFPGVSTDSAWCYDMQTNAWTALPDLPGDRAGGGLVLHRKNGKNELIYSGGVDRESNSLQQHTDYGTTWILDLDNQAAGWTDTGATMPNPRNHMAAIETCGRYFWVGGQYKQDEVNANQDTVSEYNPDTNQWVNVAPLPIPLGHISASVMAYNCGIIVVAGVSSGGARSNKVFWYSATANQWYNIGVYPIAAATPVCGLNGNQIMCTTGGPWNVQNQAYVGTLV